MSFLLDTDICSAHMKRASGLSHRFIQHMGHLAIPTLVLAELRAGAYLRTDPNPLLQQIDDLLRFLDVLTFDAACADEFGKLRGLLHRRGIAVQPIDLLIAAVALATNRVLVTHNTSDFNKIPGLQLSDWLAP
jgi:tRNA(fMet)-specific endonuclease VapC